MKEVRNCCNRNCGFLLNDFFPHSVGKFCATYRHTFTNKLPIDVNVFQDNMPGKGRVFKYWEEFPQSNSYGLFLGHVKSGEFGTRTNTTNERQLSLLAT